MDDERLIELVRLNELLYNKFKASYKLPAAKKRVWEEIGGSLGTSGGNCSKRWSVLRGHYNRERKRREAPSGSGANHTSIWTLYDAMSFLQPHMAPRPVVSSRNIYQMASNSPSSSSSQWPSPLPPTDAYAWSPPPIASSSPDPIPLGQRSKRRHKEIENEIMVAFKSHNRKRRREENPQYAAIHNCGDLIANTIIGLQCPVKQAKAIEFMVGCAMKLQIEDAESRS